MWNIVDRIIESGIGKVYPGGVLLVGKPGEVIYQKCYGTTDGKVKTRLDTRYDLASMTKVIATTTAVMKLFSEGKLTLEDKLGEYLDVGGEKANITIYQLLTHTSGMQPYSELWRYLSGKDLLKGIIELQPVCEAGIKINYSCLNFITLMAVVEIITGEYYREYISKTFESLDMQNTSFCPVTRENIAPTSIVDGKRLVGVVDDELARQLGGVSGNAGLFSNVEDLSKFSTALFTGKIVPSKYVEKFITEIVEIGDSKRHLGWMAPVKNGSNGDILQSNAFGHTGFTGTSIWVDPRTSIYTIFLANRVFIDRWGNIETMQKIRQKLHNVVFGRL